MYIIQMLLQSGFLGKTVAQRGENTCVLNLIPDVCVCTQIKDIRSLYMKNTAVKQFLPP